MCWQSRDESDPGKNKYAKSVELIEGWRVGTARPRDAGRRCEELHPTVLIGTSAQPGAFTEEIIREMARHTERPIIFPLSNPTSKSEASPADLISWTEGRALVATGSPYGNVFYNGREIPIGQCNNAFIFPGVGLGVIACGSRRVTNEMFVAAARALARFSPALEDPYGSLFPALENVRVISRDVAVEVALRGPARGSCRSRFARRDHRGWWRRGCGPRVTFLTREHYRPVFIAEKTDK